MKKDLDKYFKAEKNTYRFMGQQLDIFVPTRYESHGALEIDDRVHVMGVFDMTINESIKTGLNLPARITMDPSETEVISKGNQKYLKITLYKGDVFVVDSNIVMNPTLAYVVFYEFIYAGKRPDFVNYRNAAFLFDNVQRVTGTNFRTPHVVFEMLISHLYRDKEHVMTPYRNTDMKNDPVVIPLSAVEHAAISTTGRVVGSYLDTSINSTLVNAGEHSDIEDILRG